MHQAYADENRAHIAYTLTNRDRNSILDDWTSVPTATKRTPALAYLAALIAILVVWAAYRPLLHAWYELQNQAPPVTETLQLLRSQSAEHQRQGLASAGRIRPVPDEVLIALADLAFHAQDRFLRQQAATQLSSVAQLQMLPADILHRLPPLTPEMERNLATSYATLIDWAARRQAPPPNAIEFLDALIEQGDWSAKNTAIHALGQIGFYHGLDDKHIAQLTDLVTYEHVLGRQVHAADAAWALKLIGQKRPLPPATVEVLVELMRNGRDANDRQRAVSAVSTQLSSTPALIDEIEAALDDPDSTVRGAARNVIYRLETAKPTDPSQALQIAADEDEPNTRRLRALQRLLRQDLTDARVRSIAQIMAHHEDPVLRAGMVSMAGALPDSEAEALFAGALDDADPQVRAAAVLPLIARRATDGEEAQALLIRRLLEDPTPQVQRKVLLSVRSNNLNTYRVRAALRDMETDDPHLARERSVLLDSLERASRTRLERFWDAALEPKNYGLYAFIVVAGLAILICVPFLLYFTARCFVYLSARQWRALAALGILATWIGASFALGWAFFIGAFIGSGHNSQPPLGAQLTVVGVLLLLVGVYALLGYGLRRMVRT
jgi:HEAT repeat protein